MIIYDHPSTNWVTLEGGDASNMVPDRARTWYFIRDMDENLEHHFSLVIDCAKGAALMTQTTYKVKVLATAHQRFGNKELAKLMFENIKAVVKPEYTKQEVTFAIELQKNAGLPVKGLEYPLELASPKTFMASFNDVGDVSLITPYASLRFPVRVPGSTSHTWPVVSSGCSFFVHKGMTAGAKVVCFTSYYLLTKPEVLEKIRAEFELLTKERLCRSFLLDEAGPPLGTNASLMEKYRREMEKLYIES